MRERDLNCYERTNRTYDSRIWLHHLTTNRDPDWNSSPRRWHDVQGRYAIIPGTDLVRGDEGHPWYEISDNEGNRLHYDDSYNSSLRRSQRLAAGQIGRAFDVGQFKIVPYIWDHMNTGHNLFFLSRIARDRDDQTAGSLQRMTAFSIQRKELETAKNTFIIGSAGEMNAAWTRAFNTISITTDLLIQAIVHPYPSRAAFFNHQLEHCLNYMINNITVNDAVLFCHFEEFIRLIPGPSRYCSEFDMASKYSLAWIVRQIRRLNPPTSESIRRLFEENRFYALKRRGVAAHFEMRLPDDALAFRNEILSSRRNESVSVSFEDIDYPEDYFASPYGSNAPIAEPGP